MPNWKKVIVSGSSAALTSVTATAGFTGSLSGSATSATTASYALTSSYVDTLNQNVLITGSTTIGASSAGTSENTLTLGARDAGSEGGQLGLNAPGGTYTSASMIDNYANQFRILRGTNAGSDALIAQWNLHNKQMQLPAYNSPTAFTATTLVGLLGFDNSGNLITTTTSSGGGSGVTITNNVDNYVITATGTANTLNGESGLQYNGSSLSITGQITSSGAIISNANGAMYFRGGDDAEFWDINIANTVGIYGQQTQGIGAVKLGSGGPTLYGSGSRLGIGTTSPVATVDINGNLYVASGITGSLLGTASYATQALSSSFATTASYYGGSVTSASYALTASYVLNAVSASFATNALSASYALNATNAQTSSYVLQAVSASFATLAQTANTASYVITAQTASYVLNAISASFATLSQTANTASYVQTAQTASYVLNAVSSSYALNATTANTASYVQTAQTASYVLNAVSSSYALSASSTISSSYAVQAGNTNTINISSFGSPVESYLLMSNVIATTGVGIGGDSDLRYNSSTNVLTVPNVSATTLTGSLLGTASYAAQSTSAFTASYVLTAQTASYVLNAVSSSYALSASYARTSLSASYATTASYYGGTVTSASYALTASYVNPLKQTVILTGSLITSGSDGKGINTSTTELNGGAGTGITVNWGSGQLFDNNSINTVDWLNGYSLTAPSYGGVTTLQWGTGLLKSLTTSMSIDWGNRYAYDQNEVISIDWNGRQLIDSSTALSLDYQSRNLNDSSGNYVLGYDSSHQGYAIDSIVFYRTVLNTFIQEKFSDEPQGISGIVNYEGETLEGVLHSSILLHDLVYLDTSGTWYPITQATDQCTKLIGICVNLSKNLILLEGSITVSSNVATPDSPYVQSLAAGRPIYIRDNLGTGMSTISPSSTGQYVRVLGHAYYNSTTFTDYWIMKFRPSNDWITI